METKRPTVPWNGCMLEVDTETGAVVAPDSETEETINETVDRILPGWREAAGLTNPNERESS